MNKITPMKSQVLDILRPILMVVYLVATCVALIKSPRKLRDTFLILGASLLGAIFGVFVTVVSGNVNAGPYNSALFLYVAGLSVAMYRIYKCQAQNTSSQRIEMVPKDRTQNDELLKRISPLGVVVGGIVGIVSGNLLVLALDIYLMETHGGVTRAVQYTSRQEVLRQVLGYVGPVIGGFLAAYISGRNELLNALCSSFIFAGFGVYQFAAGKCPPTQLYLLLLPLLFALAGGFLRQYQLRVGSPSRPA